MKKPQKVGWMSNFMGSVQNAGVFSVLGDGPARNRPGSEDVDPSRPKCSSSTLGGRAGSMSLDIFLCQSPRDSKSMQQKK